MKKLLPLAASLLFLLTACASAQTLTGKARGYGGELVVQVAMEGEKITSVTVQDNKETPEIGGKAIDTLPAAIVAKNGTDVDVVAGATVTSQAIIAAVNNAMNPDQFPYGDAAATPAAPVTGETMGIGMSSLGRVGPGRDSTDTPVYSFNVVMASGRFDTEGRILDLYIDQLEVATPNYDGEGMPHLSGFPGQGGYNNDEASNGTISGKTPDTEDQFLSEISGWTTKRERGDTYRMTSGSWAEQMDKYQALFIGKTVAEVEAWFRDFCSDVNGRPLKEGSEDEKDKTKFDALSDENKAMLADVTTTATISLNDAHGNIVEAIRKAYDNRIPVQK